MLAKSVQVFLWALCFLWGSIAGLYAQGLTTAALHGIVADEHGVPLSDAVVVAVHRTNGTRYRAVAGGQGVFTIPNIKVGTYAVTAGSAGYRRQIYKDVAVELGEKMRVDFALRFQGVVISTPERFSTRPEVLSFGLSEHPASFNADQVARLPSINRRPQDLTRLNLRSDGNHSFLGRNWYFNNLSLDGSYFNNLYGFGDPTAGGATNAQPVPFESIEQVQVSLAPFDVRESGFTGANLNIITRKGGNRFKGSFYTYLRNEGFVSNKIRSTRLFEDPDLSFHQTGFSLSGPLVRNKLFFHFNAELERRNDRGTNFLADRDGQPGVGESRVRAAVLDSIRQRMIRTYAYDPGEFEDFTHETNNEKILLGLDWNIDANTNLSFRYNFLDGRRELPPGSALVGASAAGRGPSQTALPFRKAGFERNNELHSFALEINGRSSRYANHFRASYTRLRDFRHPFSEDFPTIEILEDGLSYTTLGQEPFSIHNNLNQDAWQFTDNFSLFSGRHVFTLGSNLDLFSFFSSINLFRHGRFDFLFPDGGTTFTSLDEFFAATDPNSADFIDFRALITPSSRPFKGEDIDLGQFSIYAQDEFLASERLNLTYGLRVDVPLYFTDPVDNPFSLSLLALDEDDNPETVDQSNLPGTSFLLSPRVGFNWDVRGDRVTRFRGGTGVFTGRVPFVWIGNVVSNPGANPNLPPDPTASETRTSDDTILQQSFDLNAIDQDFRWPQIWTTNLAMDQKLPWDLLGTLDLLYAKDVNAVVMRNADLVAPTRLLPDGRPFFGGTGNNELSAPFPGAQDGVYVIDNTSAGYNLSVGAQLRKTFPFGLQASLGYSFTEAKNKLRSAEIARTIWENLPVQGDPNQPELSWSEFGDRHRIVGSSTYSHRWSPGLTTHFGLFFEVAEGNQFSLTGGSRYSFTYAGDVNGDGSAVNDLIYIPRDAANSSEIIFDNVIDATGNLLRTAQEQSVAFENFIEQDDYLKSHRGEIAERFGSLNPWFSTIDIRVLQDFTFISGTRRHTFRVNLDILNFGNLLSSGWGVRKVANPAAASPLTLVRFDANGAPVFNFTGPQSTFIDDPGVLSRWQIQLGLRYLFN